MVFSSIFRTCVKAQTKDNVLQTRPQAYTDISLKSYLKLLQQVSLSVLQGLQGLTSG